MIDGDADHLTILATLLQHHGYGVMTEPDPDRGLEIAREQRPAGILLALHYGGAPLGIGLIDRLRAEPATKGIPIVVVSSFTDVHLDELEARRVPHVAKGGDMKRIITAVEEAVAGSSS